MIGAGKRDRRIRFERIVTAESGMGVDEEVAGEPIEDAMAFVRYGTGAERRSAAAEGATQAATFRVLATTALRAVAPAGFRIIDRDFADAVWNITGVAPIGRTEIEFAAVQAKA